MFTRLADVGVGARKWFKSAIGRQLPVSAQSDDCRLNADRFSPTATPLTVYLPITHLTHLPRKLAF